MVTMSVTRHRRLIRKSSSLASFDRQPSAVKSDDILRRHDSMRRVVEERRTSVRPCAVTEMLLTYAEQDMEKSGGLSKILNVLELHFNTYADDRRQIYFEGIFQLLHDFQEQITEVVLIDTMQFLKLDVLAPCMFDDVILILCHLPPIKQDDHQLLHLFNELDYDKDSFVTFEDMSHVLSHLISYFNEEVIRTAIDTIDADEDNGRLSYFDFVTSLLALQEYKLTAKAKTVTVRVPGEPPPAHAR